MGGTFRSGDKRYDVDDSGSKTHVTSPSWVPGSPEHVATVDTEDEAFSAIKSDSGSKSIKKD